MGAAGDCAHQAHGQTQATRVEAHPGKYDVGCEGLHEWNLKGRLDTVAETHDMVTPVPVAARAALWRMQAKRGLHLRGLEVEMRKPRRPR